jgi:Cu/Ag efflux pump CusA
VLTPADKDLVVRVFGIDYGVLQQQAERVRKVVGGVDGVSSPRVISQSQQPTLQVEAKIAAARRYGLKPGDVRRAAGTIVNGLEAGSFFEGQKVFAVIVRGNASTRRSITDVRNLLINTPGGGHVRLGDVATVKVTPNPVDIRHDAVERYMDVRAAVDGRSLSAVQSDVTGRLRAMRLPLEYSAEVQKASQDVQPPAGRLVALAIAAIIGIFLLLQAAFSSWRLAALVFFAAPVALVGGLLVILADGGDLSLGGLFGLFMVGGIAIRNAVVLVSRLEALRRTETEKSGLDLVVQGVRERFTPIVMTAVVVALALAPFAIGGDIAGGEIAHATAAVVLGGLVTATLLNLFLIPALYLHFGIFERATHRRRTPTADAPPVPSVEVNA